MESKAYSLFELNRNIQSAIKSTFSNALWVVGEISEINSNRSGHCYLELIEKDESEDKLVAKARATIWSYTYRMLKPYFESTTGTSFTTGIKVLVKVKVEFHELYGFSLNITDIDPNYTLGDMARKRQEVIKKLQAEGVIDMNKELDLPPVIQKIAVISSKTAAGYDDFINQLENNPYGFKFYIKLFEAVMQGDEAEKSIIDALDNIYDYEDFFDVVVVIRGGGSKADLSCFDAYWLAYNITQFPVPVLSGIGHERDESVVDMVANTRLKTPTAVAEFIVTAAAEFEYALDQYRDSFIDCIQDFLLEEKTRIAFIEKAIEVSAGQKIIGQRGYIEQLQDKLFYLKKTFIANQYNGIANLATASKNIWKRKHERAYTRINESKIRLQASVRQTLKREMHRLNMAENIIQYVDPQKVLEKGYSITTFNKKIVNSVQQVSPGDSINTRVADGVIKSLVKGIDRQE